MPDRYWKQLYQYWLSKHVDGRPPSRREIDPMIDIPQLAKNLILLDALNDFTYRLVGSEVVERHGLDMTGKKSGTSGKDPNAITAWREGLAQVMKTRAPRLLVSRIGGSDTVAKNVMLLLPLVDANGRIEMIMIGSFYNEHFSQGSHVEGMTVTEVAL